MKQTVMVLTCCCCSNRVPHQNRFRRHRVRCDRWDASYFEHPVTENVNLCLDWLIRFFLIGFRDANCILRTNILSSAAKARARESIIAA